MSGFLSEKYLRYRGAASLGTVDVDTPCPQCGYNLRGLPAGRACPECGGDTLSAGPGGHRRGKLIDAMLHGDESHRGRWKLGLTFATAVIAAMLLARVVMFGISFVGFTTEIQIVYFTFGAALSVVWTASVFLIMPATLVEHWPWMRHWRTAVLLTQPLWVVGTGCILLRVAGGPGAAGSDLLQAMQFAARGIAGVGFIILGFLLTYIAEEAELEPGWQRLNAATWMVAIPTLMAAVFPSSIPWIALVVLAFILIWWAWMLCLFMLGLGQMRQHVAWGIRHHIDGTQRLQRIAEKRAEIDANVNARIRPVSGHIVTQPTSDTLPHPAQHAPLASNDAQQDHAPIALADADDAASILPTDRAQPPSGEASQPPAEQPGKAAQPPLPDRAPPRAPGTSLWDV